jgi:hypothetical protein
LGWTCSTLLLSDFVESKRKKKKKENEIFACFEVNTATQGVSL